MIRNDGAKTPAIDTKKPAWLVQRFRGGDAFNGMVDLLTDLGLNTVCQSASCPNIGECFNAGTATFLILGGLCTRNCRFCAVPKGQPSSPDPDEPGKVAQAARVAGIRHAVVTSVTRDDLDDGGADQFVRCIQRLRETVPETSVEVLTPDFRGDRKALRAVLAAGLDVFNHNVETVPRLYPLVRPGADYHRSLRMLREAARRIRVVKSGIMVGMGEDEKEVRGVFRDLVAAGVAVLTIGQYLRPSPGQMEVVEYVHPERFRSYGEMALAAGFKSVAAGPLVRSSYHAERLFGNGIPCPIPPADAR